VILLRGEDKKSLLPWGIGHEGYILSLKSISIVFIHFHLLLSKSDLNPFYYHITALIPRPKTLDSTDVGGG